MIRKASDFKLNVRPILLGLEHLYYYEGPCRFGSGEALQPGYDKFANEHTSAAFMDTVRKKLPENVNLLEPIRAGRTDDWDNKAEMWEEFAKGNADADVVVFQTNIGVDDIALEFIERYKVPVIIPPASNFSALTIRAAAKAKDPSAEVYSPIDWNAFSALLSALRARKVIRNTNILLASRLNSDVSYSSLDTFSNHDLVTKNLGVHFRYINVHELLDQMTPAAEGGNHTTPGRITPDLTDEDLVEANKIVDELIEGAEEVHVERKFILNSVIAYLTVRKQMDLKDCNGFTVPCPDVCSTRRINEMQFTFCLTHSLNMESGIPSACEYDANAVLSQQALIAVSGQRPYMGNTAPLPFENGEFLSKWGLSKERLERLKVETGGQNLYYMKHSVPNRRFRDPNKNGRYALRHFAYDQKFGAIMRYDFEQDIDQVITLCRFSPDGGKLLIGRGTIVGGDGYYLDNCNGVIIFRVADQADFFQKQTLVGNHCVIVYGDYTKELSELASVLGIEELKAY